MKADQWTLSNFEEKKLETQTNASHLKNSIRESIINVMGVPEKIECDKKKIQRKEKKFFERNNGSRLCTSGMI